MHKEMPNNFLLEKIEEVLLQRPSYKEQHERNDSWMTSREIANWFSDKGYGEFTEEDIENFLLNKWKNSELKNIRPAKYPHLLTMNRLWGHTAKVFTLQIENAPWKTDSKIKLSKIKLPKDAPTLFLSHSKKDFKLAKKVRQTLGKDFGFDIWLFEKELDQGENIFGSVKLGIIHCDAIIVLLTSNSIGSAWIDTEIHSSNEFYKKSVITLIDGNDKELLLIMDTFLKNPASTQIDLDAVFEKYKLIEKEENRINNFKKNAINIIGYLGLYSNFSVYPPIPTNYYNSKFVDLSKALLNLKK